MNKRERQIMKKYTTINHDLLWLTIDNQIFTIAGTDRENIKWFREQLAVALARMIENDVKA